MRPWLGIGCKSWGQGKNLQTDRLGNCEPYKRGRILSDANDQGFDGVDEHFVVEVLFTQELI